MLEIFALCSCACLACLWCAVVLELTKERCCRTRFDEAFGWNCSKCSKDHRCTDRKGQIPRKFYSNDSRLKDFNHNEQKIHEMRDRVEIRKKDEERPCRCYHCLELIPTSRNPPCSKSQSFPRLRKNHCAITTCKRACKICRRVKHECACARDNDIIGEDPSSWTHLCVKRSSCPNLMSQGCCCPYHPCFHHSSFYDPYERSINPNVWKDHRECYRQGRAISRRKRCFARIRKDVK